MKNKIILICLLFSLVGCQRQCTQFSRTWEATDRDYEIVMFSGGDTVFSDSFRGMVNNSEGSDGIYYFKDGELIEVSGDYVIRSR